jgi:uncharacterized damage-inducible protein DinB
MIAIIVEAATRCARSMFHTRSMAQRRWEVGRLTTLTQGDTNASECSTRTSRASANAYERADVCDTVSTNSPCHRAMMPARQLMQLSEPPMIASTTLVSLFNYKAWANGELYSAVGTIDAAKHESERHTCIRLLNHIYTVDRIFVNNLQRTAHGFTATNTSETPTLDVLQADVRDTDRWYVDYVSRLTANELSEPIEFMFTDDTPARMTREEMLLHVSLHGGYHRGAVGRILAQLGISPPRDLFTGFLHRSEPERRNRG